MTEAAQQHGTMTNLIESPCIKVCVMDPDTGLCEGCRRTLQEIASWGNLPPQERRRIMSELPGRPGKRGA